MLVHNTQCTTIVFCKVANDKTMSYILISLPGKFVPKDELHEDTFKGCFRQFGQPRGRMNSIRRHNSYAAAPDTERIGRNLMRRAGQEIKKEQILKEMGVDFKIDGYVSQPAQRSIFF